MLSSRPSDSEWRDLRIYGLLGRREVRRSLDFARDDRVFGDDMVFYFFLTIKGRWTAVTAMKPMVSRVAK